MTPKSDQEIVRYKPRAAFEMESRKKLADPRIWPKMRPKSEQEIVRYKPRAAFESKSRKVQICKAKKPKSHKTGYCNYVHDISE